MMKRNGGRLASSPSSCSSHSSSCSSHSSSCSSHSSSCSSSCSPHSSSHSSQSMAPTLVVSLDEILKFVYHRHENSVYVDLAEEHRNVRDSWWQVKVMSLLSLTRMACQNEPLDIFIQHGPPENLNITSDYHLET